MQERLKQIGYIILLYTPTLLLVGIDQLTKFLAHSYLDWVPNKILPFFSLTLACNTGAAFSMFKDFGGILLWIGSIFSLFFIYQIYRSRNEGFLVLSGYTCVLAGALGNVVDRLIRGCVIDFLHVHAGKQHAFGGYEYNFPIFNVADSLITIGFVLVVWVLLTNARQKPSDFDFDSKS